nr:hypothetical protein Iba_chr15dCG6150 [Ipomoea batatas]
MLRPRPRLICFVGVGGRELVSDLLSSPVTSREVSSDMLHPRPRLICFVSVGGREVVSDLLSSPATSREASSDMLRPRPCLICFVGVGDREVVSDLLSSPATSREVSSDMLRSRPRLICFVGVGGFRSALLVVLSAASAALKLDTSEGSQQNGGGSKEQFQAKHGNWYEEAKEMGGGETHKRWSQRSKEGGGGRPMRLNDIGRGWARKRWSRRMRELVRRAKRCRRRRNLIKSTMSQKIKTTGGVRRPMRLELNIGRGWARKRWSRRKDVQVQRRVEARHVIKEDNSGAGGRDPEKAEVDETKEEEIFSRKKPERENRGGT